MKMKFHSHINIIFKLLIVLLLSGCLSQDNSTVEEGYLPGIDPEELSPEVSINNFDYVNSYNQESVLFSGSCNGAIEKVEITLSSGQIHETDCLNKQWSLSLNLTDLLEGTENFSVRAVDRFDQEVSKESSFEKDTQAPLDVTSFAKTNPVENYSTEENIFLQAMGLSGDYLLIYQYEYCSSLILEQMITTPNEIFNVVAVEGVNNFSIRTRDLAGNFSNCVSSGEYIKDTIAPTDFLGTLLTSPGDGESSKDNTPVFSSSSMVSENGSLVRLFRDENCLFQRGSTQTITNDSFLVNDFSLALDGSEDGLNSFYGTIEDQAGNNSGCLDLNLSYTLEPTGLASLDKIAMVGNNSQTDLIALEDNISVELNDTEIDDSVSLGEVITFNASQGDTIKCSGACFVVTEGFGTAPWASEAYSGKKFTTFVSRYGQYGPRFYVALFEDDSDVSLIQNGAVVRTLEGDTGDILVFDDVIANSAVQIESNKNIVIYFGARSNGSSNNYDQDARVLTPSALEVIGLSGYVSANEDNTNAQAYKNNGSTYSEADLDTNESISAGGTDQGRFAITAEADKPIAITQIADRNGTNATPSLPKSMLATHYGLSRRASYVSFASYEDGEVEIISPAGASLGTLDMTKTTGNPKAPYVLRYTLDPNLPSSATSHPIPAGTRFICSVPCLAVYDDIGNNQADETLMMGFTP